MTKTSVKKHRRETISGKSTTVKKHTRNVSKRQPVPKRKRKYKTLRGTRLDLDDHKKVTRYINYAQKRLEITAKREIYAEERLRDLRAFRKNLVATGKDIPEYHLKEENRIIKRISDFKETRLIVRDEIRTLTQSLPYNQRSVLVGHEVLFKGSNKLIS